MDQKHALVRGVLAGARAETRELESDLREIGKGLGEVERLAQDICPTMRMRPLHVLPPREDLQEEVAGVPVDSVLSSRVLRATGTGRDRLGGAASTEGASSRLSRFEG